MWLKTKNGYEFEIDENDFDLVSQYNWHGKRELRRLSNGQTRKYNSYIKANIWRDGKRTGIDLHNLLTNPPFGMQTDHIDGNGLNNKRNNLRICTYSQNQANRKLNVNSSGYKGVRWRSNRWQARIKQSGKAIHLGCFRSKEEAAMAYDRAAIQLWGEFAKPNLLSMPIVPKEE